MSTGIERESSPCAGTMVTQSLVTRSDLCNCHWHVPKPIARVALLSFFLLSSLACAAEAEPASCSAAESISGTVTSFDGASAKGRVLLVLEEATTRPRERVPWFVPVQSASPDPTGFFQFCAGASRTFLLAIATQELEWVYSATLIPDVKSGAALGTIAIGPLGRKPPRPARIQGIVTSATAPAPASMITLSVVASVDQGRPETEFKYTVPLSQQNSESLRLTLTRDSTCGKDAACAGYTLWLPSQAAVVRVGGRKIQRSVPPIYLIEARATNPASEREEGCSSSSATLRQPNGHWLVAQAGAQLTASPLRLQGCEPMTEASRRYLPVAPSRMVNNRRTHVEITGKVTEVSEQADGDIHVRIEDDHGFVIAECIPALPEVRRQCAALLTGSTVTVHGISRYDFEHNWWEVHPVETVIPGPR